MQTRRQMLLGAAGAAAFVTAAPRAVASTPTNAAEQQLNTMLEAFYQEELERERSALFLLLPQLTSASPALKRRASKENIAESPDKPKKQKSKALKDGRDWHRNEVLTILSVVTPIHADTEGGAGSVVHLAAPAQLRRNKLPERRRL